LALDPQSRIRFNLEGAAVLLVDETPMGMSILVSVVTGLGAKLLYRCSNVEAAQEAVAQHHIDLASSTGWRPPARATISSNGSARAPVSPTASPRSC
jgi:hypothetical protein